MKPYVTMGLTVLAGAALFEVALVPGILIGGAAVLAPKYLPRVLRRRRQASRLGTDPAAGAASRAAQLPVRRPRAILPRFQLGQAIAKTITFRIMVTSLDFATNYVVIGELATAAGLSSFNLVAGPLFYLGHEAIWSHFGRSEVAIELSALADTTTGLAGRGELKISRALAKTITFRTIASAVDFTVNYVVVGDVATAFALSATGLILGPFVYFGHEKAWEYFTAGDRSVLDLSVETSLLPAPG
ncbi:MAG TPA: DUF2061 domain-containing protein [Bradyrhizobium sp.]|nr:DUF2061 domain-containing protein [Bradyrhizobium sp.]